MLVKRHLARALIELGKLEEDEPLVLDAYNQMKANAETIPPYLREGCPKRLFWRSYPGSLTQ